MSAFLSDLRMTMIVSSDGVPLKSPAGNQLYVLDAPLIYQSDYGFTITAPEGFMTDLSSIPKLPFIYTMLDGMSDLPAVTHDYLYTFGELPRSVADMVLYEACLVIGLPRWHSELIYLGVRAGGARHYLSS